MLNIQKKSKKVSLWALTGSFTPVGMMAKRRESDEETLLDITGAVMQRGESPSLEICKTWLDNAKAGRVKL